MDFHNRTLLERARDHLPFLHEIPDALYFTLDPAEFLIPDPKLSQAREHLERALGHYVMTYRMGISSKSPPERHLCARLAAARLKPDQVALVRKFEWLYRDRGVVFVAYRKPLWYLI